MTPRRNVLYSVGLLVVAWSGWIVMQREHDNRQLVAPTLPAPRPAAAPVGGTALVAQAPAESLPSRSALASEPSADSFAARSWVPPPPPPPPPPKAAPPPPPPQPPPPPPVVLPYRLVGLIDEGRAGHLRAFLSLNDKLLVAVQGETLEGGFRVDSITAQEIVFTHLQRNVTLKLSVQGAPS